MGNSFNSLVDLCRLATERNVSGTDLVLRVMQCQECRSLMTSVTAGGWDSTFRYNGQEVVDLGRIPDREVAEIVIHGLTRATPVLVNNTGMLLRYLQGRYLQEKPAEFYLLQEDYASWEEPTDLTVLAYFRALKVVGMLERLADITRDSQAGAYKEAVLLASRRLIVPLVYDSISLDSVASDEVIGEMEEALAETLHKDARRDIVKRVFIRFFESTPERERFGQILCRLHEVLRTFTADFEVYSTAFTYDKVREEFDRKKLDFVVKVHTASSDVMNKLIAIPIGQALLASQMKNDAGLHVVNEALLTGSIVFAFVALVFLVNQIVALSQIQGELEDEKTALKERAPPTYERLREVIHALERRLRFHKWVVPCVLAVLLVVTTGATVIAFLSMP